MLLPLFIPAILTFNVLLLPPEKSKGVNEFPKWEIPFVC